MIVRKLTANDHLSLQKLWSICFMYSIDLEEAEKKAKEKSEAPAGYGAFTEEGEMIAGVIGNRLTMNFDGQKASLIGIGGVVTHPSHRKSGAIKGIMKSLLTEAREQGSIFSGLYPFNHDFYRKFGYELSRDLETYTFPFTSILKYSGNVKTRLLEPKDDRSFLMPVYESMTKRYQLAIDRDQEAFNRLTATDPYAKNDYTYAIYDGEEPCAYVAFSKKNAILSVRDYAFKTEKDFRKILSFLSRFGPEFEKVEIALPEDPNRNAYKRPVQRGKERQSPLHDARSQLRKSAFDDEAPYSFLFRHRSKRSFSSRKQRKMESVRRKMRNNRGES